MDTLSLIASIARSDDAEGLSALREEIEASDVYSESEREEINAAINLRFNLLNLQALTKQKTTEGK